MKLLIINGVCGFGSTGRICIDIAKEYEKKGFECKIAYGRCDVKEEYEKYAVRIGNNLDVFMHLIKARLFDGCGFGSKIATKKFLRWAEEFNPDILWIHNIHGYYINIEMLFEWIKKRPQMEVKWTLHDCWAFTGHCTHFTTAQCNSWTTQCKKCRQTHLYPYSVISNCTSNFKRKKRAFAEVSNMTIITPSQWLAELVKQSFLKDYTIEVHHNTIDTTVFKPTPSEFRKHYGLENKKIVLGVANVWNKHKGLQDFIELRKKLDDSYTIILVGLTVKQIKSMPKDILCIARTSNVKELVEIYTAADVFVNPSCEETFGMTTIEAEACGTPAIVYKETACEEIVKSFGGVAVAKGVDNIYAELMKWN